jgi:hypothetical protein
VTVFSAQGAPVQLDPAGTGPVGAVVDASSIAAHGSGFVVVQPNAADPTHSTFTETGAYELTQADGLSALGSRDITLTYSVAGSINLFTGTASFSAGTIDLYSDAALNFGSASANPSVVFGANDGTHIVTFQISSGGLVGGAAHLEGSAAAGSILPGYFFSGQDLSQSQQLQFSVDLSNVINPSPSATVVSELVCKSGFPGPGCDGTPYANTPFYFVGTDGANVVLSAVPEPSTGTLALAGGAGLWLLSRRTRRQ